MKKILILSLVAMGTCAASMSARADGLSVSFALSRPCPPIFVSARVPICVPAPVYVSGCAPRVIVRDCDRDVRYRHEVRRDVRYYHGRF
jgi:hypothetical protein